MCHPPSAATGRPTTGSESRRAGRPLLASLEYPSWRTPAPARPCPSPTSACPAALVAVLAEAGITAPFPIQTATLPDSLAGPRRPRPRPHRLRQDLRLRAPAARPAGRRPRQAPARPPARADPRPDPRAGQPDRGRDGPAGRRRSTCARITIFGGVGPNPQIQGLRNGVDIVIACPGRLDDHVQSGPLRPRRRRDHRARRGRPHGRPRLPARSYAAPRQDADATASGCCSRPPSTPASTCWSSASCTTRSRTASTRPSRRSAR